MRGLWWNGSELSFRTDLPMPQLDAGEALIRMRMAGVCSTDLEILRGYTPFQGVLGHEFVGEVVAAPSEPGWLGKRVVGEINIACGNCAPCRAGRKSHCVQRSVLGIRQRAGVFAECCTLPVENLLAIPAGLADASAVFTEPLAAALRIMEQVHILPSQRVLVIGAGRLGLLIAMALQLSGCWLEVAARQPRARALLQRCSIPAIDSSQIFAGSYDVVIDATGSPEGFDAARRATRPGGVLVLKSTYAGETQVDLSRLVVDEIQIIGSRCGPFEPAIRLLAAGLIDPAPLVEAVFPLASGKDAFTHASQPGALKVLLSGCDTTVQPV